MRVWLDTLWGGGGAGCIYDEGGAGYVVEVWLNMCLGVWLHAWMFECPGYMLLGLVLCFV